MNETRIAEIRALAASLNHGAPGPIAAALTELLGEVERLTERAEAAEAVMEIERGAAAKAEAQEAAAEAKLAKAKEALHQCIGNLKALGAEDGWGAEIARRTISEIDES